MNGVRIQWGQTREDRVTNVGDAAVSVLREHEVKEHDGERCGWETVNVLAYVAWRIGLDPEMLEEEWGVVLAERMRAHEARNGEFNVDEGSHDG